MSKINYFKFVPFIFIAILIFFKLNHLINSNEYNYFLQGQLNFGNYLNFDNYAAYDSSKHKFLFDLVTYSFFYFFDVNLAFFLLKIFIVIGYTSSLYLLSKVFKINPLVVTLALVFFIKSRQSYFGGEWLFDGVEAKVFSYIFLFYSLYFIKINKISSFQISSFLSILFHFQVGFFWSSIFLFYAYLNNKNIGFLFRNFTLLFFYCLFVITIFILSTPSYNLISIDDSIRTTNFTSEYIYAVLRAPHHTLPFINNEFSHWIWKKGFFDVVCYLAVMILIFKLSTSQNIKNISLTLSVVHIYLIFCVFISYFDQTNLYLAKFYMFRPASLAKLLSNIFLLSIIYNIFSSFKITYFFSILLIIVAIFNNLDKYNFGSLSLIQIDKNTSELTDWIEINTSGYDRFIVLDTNSKHLINEHSFEFFIKRPSLVNWKFVPTSSKHIYDWYLNILRKQDFSSNPCNYEYTLNFDYILEPVGTNKVNLDCFAIVFSNTNYRVYKTK